MAFKHEDGMTRRPVTYARDPRAMLSDLHALKLTDTQAAIYAVLLELVYDGGGRTTADAAHVASYLRNVTPAKAHAAIGELVRMGKFRRVNGALIHDGAIEDLRKREELSEKRAKAGRKGGLRKASKGNPLILADNSEAIATFPKLVPAPGAELPSDGREKQLLQRLRKKVLGFAGLPDIEAMREAELEELLRWQAELDLTRGGIYLLIKEMMKKGRWLDTVPHGLQDLWPAIRAHTQRG